MDMHSRTIISSLIFCLAGAMITWAQTNPTWMPDGREDGARITWNIESGQEINKRQAERLYLDAYRWVDENVSRRKGTAPPYIVVHVGKPCPDENSKGPCVNPVTGEIYLPKWENASPAAIAQGTISTMLLHLLDAKEITRTAERLLLEDRSVYLDFMAKGVRQK